LRYGGKVIGICGGFQMLGQTIADPQGVEGLSGSAKALGFLELTTEMTTEKRLAQVSGFCTFADATVAGYEIHMGTSSGTALSSPSFLIDGRPEGARSQDDQILGTYLHGLFDTPSACLALLQWAGIQTSTVVDLGQLREQSLDRIADTAEPLFDKLVKISVGSRYRN